MSNIPKIIHYCWFGGQEKNTLIQNCISTWKVHLPDYEIIEWNESNCDFDCDFARKAFELKKWAFLSDYVRLKALAEHGGLYLDTDMFFVKPIDPLLDERCFIGRQKDGQIAAGIIGAEPDHSFIKYCMQHYQVMTFDENRLMNMAIPRIITEVYEVYPQQNQVHILPYSYFYAYLFEDSLKGIDFRKSILPETIALHLWNASWFTEKELAGFALEERRYLKAVALLLTYAFKNPSFLMKLPKVAFRYITGKKKNEE